MGPEEKILQLEKKVERLDEEINTLYKILMDFILIVQPVASNVIELKRPTE